MNQDACRGKIHLAYAMANNFPSDMNKSPGESPDFVLSDRKLDGRMERRLPIITVVRLSHVQKVPGSEEERTYTDNVSAHGARVFSRRCWTAGEQVRVTSVKDESSIYGQVIYCQRFEKDRYWIGLKFPERPLGWSALRRYNGT